MGKLFSKSSPQPPPSSAELNKPWRKVTWREKNVILTNLEGFTSTDNKVLRILLYGPTGTGKSCFVNSVQKVLLGRNVISAQEQTARAGQSFTVKIKTHKMKKQRGGLFPFVFTDIMGLEENSLGGIQTEDIVNILKGHISDGYDFNPMRPITADHPSYKAEPNPEDKVHCLVCILPADSVSRMNDVFAKMNTIRKKAVELDIPHAIVLTKVDQACEVVNQNLQKIYLSRTIKEKVEECSNKLGIPLNNIYPVQNYHTEISPDEATDNLLLMALNDIVNFANDHVEDRDDE
ncbi:interferon-induced protein 44-like [Astyanax mexicanus]|uniref:Interferon-induced protein 44-like n=1 Tax=Astyanax mexicanus TaxID=7994 RepID=A0A8B9J998_ASTMX|nr:interferon-induced protein 44-like [Astyanax mexicanus]